MERSRAINCISLTAGSGYFDWPSLTFCEQLNLLACRNKIRDCITAPRRFIDHALNCAFASPHDKPRVNLTIVRINDESIACIGPGEQVRKSRGGEKIRNCSQIFSNFLLM